MLKILHYGCLEDAAGCLENQRMLLQAVQSVGVAQEVLGAFKLGLLIAFLCAVSKLIEY